MFFICTNMYIYFQFWLSYYGALESSMRGEYLYMYMYEHVYVYENMDMCMFIDVYE
jgi:hypothetical protein